MKNHLLPEVKESSLKNIDVKTLGGHILECKQEDRNGVPVGIIEGYIATWDLDRGNGFIQDKFIKGAFKKSIREFKRSGRQVRFKDHHGRTVGGFPADTLKEDDIGLFGRGEINLNVQQGNEAYQLALQGVLEDFSVGFQTVKSNRDEQKDIRIITEAILWEGSIVDEPMNPKAKITDVKDMENDMGPITEDEVKEFTERDLEDALREGKTFTKKGAIMVASLFQGVKPPETEEQKAAREANDQKAADEEKAWGSVLDDVKSLTESMKE